MWRTASPLVPGVGHAPHHHTHITEALAIERWRALASDRLNGTDQALAAR
jgi:hypothetical protein